MSVETFKRSVKLSVFSRQHNTTQHNTTQRNNSMDTFIGNTYVVLIDDGTLDTVLSVDGQELRFGQDACARNPDGSIPQVEFNELAEMAVEIIETQELAVLGRV